MADLISRAEAMDVFREKPPNFYHKSYIVGEINCLPSVDAVPVVRCRDCKWWDKDQTTDGVKGFCPNTGCGEQPDFYCADGERRDGT